MSESISQLPAATQANATDLIPATQGSIGPGTGTTRAVTQAQIIAAGGTVTSNITLDAGGGWSSNNVGKQLLVTTPAAASNPGIGITDSNGANLWGVWNHSGVLTMSVMPAYSDDLTGPTNIASLSSTGIAVTGTLAASTPGTTGNQVVNFSQFTQSIASSGYISFPGGIIIQWGSVITSNPSGGITATFPTTFPTAVFVIHASPFSSGANYATFQSPSTSAVFLQAWASGGAAAPGITIDWIAIGH